MTQNRAGATRFTVERIARAYRVPLRLIMRVPPRWRRRSVKKWGKR